MKNDYIELIIAIAIVFITIKKLGTDLENVRRITIRLR